MVNYKLLFYIWLLISLILLASFYIYAQSKTNSLRECWEYNQDQSEQYNRDYEWKCPDGEKKFCYNENLQNIAICDKVDMNARCVDKDNSWITCDKDDYTVCIDGTTQDYAVCNAGEKAICVKEGIYSVYSGKNNYVNQCLIGEVAWCMSY